MPDLTVWPCTLAGAEAKALDWLPAQLGLAAGQPSIWALLWANLCQSLCNGQQTTCSGQLTLKLQLQSFKVAITCHIMKLPEQYDVILGDAFIRQTCAITESDHQGLKRMSLKKGSKRITVTRPGSAESIRSHCPSLKCHASWERQSGGGIACFLIRVMPKECR